MKVNFSSGGCQKLPNWGKITHQNADLLQFVRKILVISNKISPEEIFFNFFLFVCWRGLSKGVGVPIREKE